MTLIETATGHHVLSELAETCHSISVQHGFWNHANIRSALTAYLEAPNPSIIGEKLALIHSEVSEALEIARSGTPDMEGMREELADVVIRTLDLATWIGGAEEFADALVAKIETNTQREHKHGKAF